MDKHVAKIQFIRYKIDQIDFKSNSNYIDSDQPLGLDVDFDASISVISNENAAIVSLKCTINKEYLSSDKPKPFYLKVVLLGYFKYEANLGEQELESLLTTNALAIIFPFLRAAISTITVNCGGIPPVIIPTFNIAEFIKNKGDITIKSKS
ncbi:MAG: protein-export chaperone SecB [Desulfitobacteriaceae bacterium]|nr:protein-export chaperone SecB [Desulfitobacteriaceae bacterium]